MTGPEQLIEYLARLSRVTEALRSPIALADLAETCGTSSRTIQRDIHFLKSLGAPIVLSIKPYRWKLTRAWSFWNAIKRAAGE